MKKGILIVSFGTTYQDTREKNIERIVTTVGEHFPDCAIWQAYSSDIVRGILRKRDGILILTIQEALQEMKEAGIRQVGILPTHIIDGVENNKMKDIIAQFADSFEEIKVAGALLHKEEDYAPVAAAFWESVKDVVGERILVLMGHGSYHDADISYGKLETALQNYSGREIYIATVEGSTTIEDVIHKLARLGEYKKQAVLMPFMLVAGDHAVNDMAGEEDSYYTKLTEQGYQVECVLKGIGEYELMRGRYIQHLEEVFL